MFGKIVKVDRVSLHLNKSEPPGLSIQAIGAVNTSGWKNPELIPWVYFREPTDGIQDFDFVAVSPSGNVLQVITPIVADISIHYKSWIKGVRIHSSSNSIVGKLDNHEDCASSFVVAGGEIPWPI